MNTIKNLILVIIIGLNISCINSSYLTKDGNVYLYQGKEKIIVSFSDQEPNEQLLKNTAKTITLLKNKPHKSLQKEQILIEGLTDNEFYNFHKIADSLFFIKPYYQNKTLIYGYIASLYKEFVISDKSVAFIPLLNLNKITPNVISKKEYNFILDEIVNYAVQELFFVSILELFERQHRYFYPQKTQEELYQVLIYPESLRFWEYLELRYGKSMLLNYATNLYKPEEFHAIFGIELHQLEAEYVEKMKKAVTQSSLLSDTNFYNHLTNNLYLYMSGTKKSLLKN